MKNIDIHNGLDKSEVRDLIAKGFVDALIQSNNNPSYDAKPRTKEDNPFSWHVKRCERDLARAKENLDLAKKQEAYATIMYNFGWDEYDVSEETSVPYSRLYMSFIGTEEEYKELLNQIKNEK